MNYFKFHIGDYASHTRYLTPMQDLAYRRLLDLYYLSEKPIPLDQPELFIGMNECSTDVERVLNAFFVKTEKGWLNKRANDEIMEFHRTKKANSEAGRKSGESRRAKKDAAYERPFNDRSTTLEQPLNQPLTINHITTVSSSDDQGSATTKKQTSKGSRLPADWVLPDDWRVWAQEKRPDLDPLVTAESFKDWWLSAAGSKGVKLDWFATWRNWVRNQKTSNGYATQAKQGYQDDYLSEVVRQANAADEQEFPF